MQLYIYRHAMMGSSHSGKSTQGEAGLSDLGRQQVKNLGPIVRELGVDPKVLMTSPLTRAKETAELSCKIFWNKSKIVMTDALLPKATPENLYRELNDYSSEQQIVVVTHYPLIEKLVSNMLGYSFESELMNGSMMRIDFTGKVSRGSGKLISIIAPPENHST